MPDYYPFLAAAKYLGVAPWDLAGIPETAGCMAWIYWATEAAGAEADAREAHARRERRAAQLARGRRR